MHDNEIEQLQDVGRSRFAKKDNLMQDKQIPELQADLFLGYHLRDVSDNIMLLEQYLDKERRSHYENSPEGFLRIVNLVISRLEESDPGSKPDLETILYEPIMRHLKIVYEKRKALYVERMQQAAVRQAQSLGYIKP